MLVYWAKMYARQEEESRPYKQLKKAIQIVVTNFNFLSKSHYHSKFQLLYREDSTIFSSHIEIHVLELRKSKEIELGNTTALERWLLFLKGDQQMKELIAMESETMHEAFEEIKRLSQDRATRALAHSREQFLKDQLQREMDAERRGKEEHAQETVLNMNKMNFSIETIAEATGLSAEKVQDIIRKNIQ